MNKKLYVLTVLMTMVLMILPEMAFAGNAIKPIVSGMIRNDYFKKGLDFVLLFYAIYKWVMFFKDFDAEKLLSDVWKPIVVTFLAFQLVQMLGWFGLI